LGRPGAWIWLTFALCAKDSRLRRLDALME
jgi:hypothetical protein